MLKHEIASGAHVRSVLPILCDCLAVAMNRIASGNTKVQIIVLAGSQRCIETPNEVKDASLIHHRRVHSDVVESQHVQIVRILNASALCRRYWNAVRRNQAVVSINKRALAVSSNAMGSYFESVRKQPVVSIEKDQSITRTGRNTGISRRG